MISHRQYQSSPIFPRRTQDVTRLTSSVIHFRPPIYNLPRRTQDVTQLTFSVIYFRPPIYNLPWRAQDVTHLTFSVIHFRLHIDNLPRRTQDVTHLTFSVIHFRPTTQSVKRQSLKTSHRDHEVIPISVLPYTNLTPAIQDLASRMSNVTSLRPPIQISDANHSRSPAGNVKRWPPSINNWPSQRNSSQRQRQASPISHLPKSTVGRHPVMVSREQGTWSITHLRSQRTSDFSHFDLRTENTRKKKLFNRVSKELLHDLR